MSHSYIRRSAMFLNYISPKFHPFLKMNAVSCSKRFGSVLLPDEESRSQCTGYGVLHGRKEKNCGYVYHPEK